MYPNTLTIAGSDSGGGAGIQADLRTFTAHHCFGASVITALTAQNSQGVASIFPISNSFIEEQLKAVLTDMRFNAVKIGMIHRPDISHIIAKTIQQYQLKNVVLDPVMIATSGDKLIESGTVEALIDLASHTQLLTPNLSEASAFFGEPITSVESMVTAGTHLSEQLKTSILMKGGHLTGHDCTDVLVQYPSLSFQLFTSKRIETNNLHGTGCTLSSAIAANLAHGLNLIDAIYEAKTYVTDAIKNASHHKIGQGNGPIFNFRLENLAEIVD